MSKKQQLLDPLCTIVRLILLNFKVDGTKIYILNNRVCLDPPHKIQSVERFFHGDSRHDICILGNAINNFIVYYLGQYKNDAICDKLFILTKYACSGLKRLQKTYYDLNNKIFDNCIYTIQYYITLLLNVLNGVDYENKYVLNMNDSSSNLLDDNKMKTLWQIDDIDELYKQFYKCFDGEIPIIHTDKNVIKNLSIIETLVSTMENRLAELLKTTNEGS
jgi:hypothetical protein